MYCILLCCIFAYPARSCLCAQDQRHCAVAEWRGGGNYGEPEISQSHIQITQKLYFTQCNMHILYSSTRKQWGKSRGDGGLPRKIVQPTEISGKGEIGTVGDSLFLPRLIRLFLYNGLEEEATRKMRFFFFSQSSKRNFVARFAVVDFFTIFFFFVFRSLLYCRIQSRGEIY